MGCCQSRLLPCYSISKRVINRRRGMNSNFCHVAPTCNRFRCQRNPHCSRPMYYYQKCQSCCPRPCHNQMCCQSNFKNCCSRSCSGPRYSNFRTYLHPQNACSQIYCRSNNNSFSNQSFESPCGSMELCPQYSFYPVFICPSDEEFDFNYC